MSEKETLKDFTIIFLVSALFVALFIGFRTIHPYLEKSIETYLEQHPDIIENLSEPVESQGIISPDSFLWYIILGIYCFVVVLLFYYGGLSACTGDYLVLLPAGAFVVITANFVLGGLGVVLLLIIACVSWFVVCRYESKCRGARTLSE